MGAPSQVKPPHTQTSYAGTRAIKQRGASVVRYNCLFAWTIITRRHGMVRFCLPWGKGLNQTCPYILISRKQGCLSPFPLPPPRITLSYSMTHTYSIFLQYSHNKQTLKHFIGLFTLSFFQTKVKSFVSLPHHLLGGHSTRI